MDNKVVNGRVQKVENLDRFGMNKHYNETEKELLKLSLKLMKENKRYSTTELAEALVPILGRTHAGIKARLYALHQEMFTESEKPDWYKKNKLNTTSQTIKSDIQIIKSHVPLEALEDFTEDDVGKRIEVEVYNLKHYGAFCKTLKGKSKSGLLLKSMISTEYVVDIEDYLKVGDTLKVLVIEDKRNPGKILLNAKIIGNIIPVQDR